MAARKSTDPKAKRYVPGSDPVPPEDQILEWPSDSAAWMNNEPQEYEDGEPLFPGKPKSQEATDG